MPYSAQDTASFQNETEFVGVGNYKEEYDKQTKRHIDKAKDDIEDMSHRIYANVLTIMGVLVAIFSLITINYQAFVNTTITLKYIVATNLTLTLCIVVMLGIIMIFINRAKEKKFIWIYGIILVMLAIATIIMGLSI